MDREYRNCPFAPDYKVNCVGDCTNCSFPSFVGSYDQFEYEEQNYLSDLEEV